MSLPGRLGVALSGHSRSWATTLELAHTADRGAFDVVFVDGDEAHIEKRPEAQLYDGGALSAAVLHATRRIRVASIRLPGFAHVALVARALATLQLTSGGRVVGFFAVGSGRSLRSLGLPSWSAAERVRALDESLAMLRELWRGAPVTAHGRFARLEGATAPRPEPAIPLAVAAARPAALRVVQRHADIWDANVPPLRRLLEPLQERLERPLETWLWIFARPGASESEAIRAYRHHCPWFPELEADEYRRALLFGDPSSWPERLARLQEDLAIDLPVLDLIGLDRAAAERALRPFVAAEAPPMA